MHKKSYTQHRIHENYYRRENYKEFKRITTFTEKRNFQKFTKTRLIPRKISKNFRLKEFEMQVN